MQLLARHHTVVAVDLRGAGHSDSPQGGYKAKLAADVHGAMTSLGFRHYAVCDHDIGAMVALALACTRRDAVTHLTLLDCSMPGWSEWDTNFADPRNWHFAFHLKRDLPERLIFGREYDYVSTSIADHGFDHGAHSFEDMEVFARALAQPGNTRGGLERYRAFPTKQVNAPQMEEDPADDPCTRLGRRAQVRPAHRRDAARAHARRVWRQHRGLRAMVGRHPAPPSGGRGSVVREAACRSAAQGHKRCRMGCRTG
ncbi:alpha/beta fold hydrolase [Lichenifustis flavocetrariae]|uniref:alpha/beta fold hydrolase n=1 Tax=Lichenifustis flavocetrariae TaxID=2949735 RepID=UPI0031F513EB